MKPCLYIEFVFIRSGQKLFRMLWAGSVWVYRVLGFPLILILLFT